MWEGECDPEYWLDYEKIIVARCSGSGEMPPKNRKPSLGVTLVYFICLHVYE